MTEPKHTNRLADETSPYLLQHSHNPVDWYAWGEEAFRRARAENKPVFLSIGYSACHWCHVMERESFEDESVAEILNREFVSIKVDREERPDIDSIYMQAVQMMTGHGGWPMSMFLTPDAVPFFGGTYFPPEERHGLPSFRRVLQQVSTAFRSRPDDVERATGEIRTALASFMSMTERGAEVTRPGLDYVARQIAKTFDAVNGGFGGAPKFPPSMTLDFLMQVAWRSGDENYAGIIATTLRKMARGGIFDQIGGGFHRYSVDERWLVPHFEKMLYDNALLARLYVRAWQWTRDPEMERVARETLGFVAREMTSPEGSFYSTLDADSEGVEGKFYVWSRSEILAALGPEEGRAFCALFDVSDRGNWEGANILNVPRDPDVVAGDLGISTAALLDIASRGRCHLFGERSKRLRPARDEKILAGWNGWMLSAFAEAALAFDDARYLEITRASADFLLGRMIDGEFLYRSYKEGRRKIAGLLEDFAGVTWGLISAWEATFELRYLEAARMLARHIVERFADPEHGGFYDTAEDHEKLITRPKDLFDNATPSGNSLAIDVLQRLALYFGEESFARAAREALVAAWPLASKYPSGFGLFLCAAEWATGNPKEIVLTGPASDPAVQALRRTVGQTYLPHRILASPAAARLPLLEGRPADQVRAYVCEGYRCDEPTADPDRLSELLQAG